MPSNHEAFWQRHPGLNWSNPAAADSAYIRAALLAPRFLTLLAIAVEFGLPTLKQEWAALRAAAGPGIERARPTVERCLTHIEEGANAAAFRD